MHHSVLIAVLAAGASRRLGQPKQLVSVSGEPLLRRQCRIAVEANIGAVTAILGFHAQAFATALADLPVCIHINEQWHEGIASSIRAATHAAMNQKAAALLLMLADQHCLMASDLQRLHEAWEMSNGVNACRARAPNYTGPPVILPAACFPALLRLEGDEGARRVLAALGPSALIDVLMPNAVFDLDCPEQLSEIESSKSPHFIR